MRAKELKEEGVEGEKKENKEQDCRMPVENSPKINVPMPIKMKLRD